MSYRQAFHTSCRTGLSGHPGFQYNAVSGGLDEEQLAHLVTEHSGYRAAPDAPTEPSAEEIAALPVSLRYLPVEGVGPVVSRTAYVGREFRGADGEPDSGRFGNYFSHIVVGAGGERGGAGFDGLLPIELWGAPHWSTAEAPATELPPLPSLEPGPVDLDRVLERLGPSRGPALAAVLDACLRAVLDGPRAVIIEADPDYAVDWIAWASYALPPDRASALTFSTFEGRPRLAGAVRACVTTPGCDVDFPAYELDSAVSVVDAAAPPAEAGLCLYARVAVRLAAAGAEAVLARTRELQPGLDLEAAGAQLAVLAGLTNLAEPAEVPPVLAALRERLGQAPAAELAALAAALPAANDAALPAADDAVALAEWSRLHAAARLCADPEAVEVVDEALRRLLDSLGALDGLLTAVEPSAPVAPSVGTLASWLERVSAAAGSERLGATVAAGATLGLVGCNTALDKELAAAIAVGFDDPAVRQAYERLARDGNERLVQGVALDLAAAVAQGASLAALRHVAADPVARAAVRENAERDGGFEALAAWELLRVEEDPALRSRAVTALAALAATERQAELIRDLFGEAGPVGAGDHTELLSGWAEAGRRAPPEDYRRALALLAKQPLKGGSDEARLFLALRGAPKELRAQPEYRAWWLLAERAPKRQDFPDWAAVAVSLDQVDGAELSPSRREEVAALAAQVAADSLGEEGYGRSLEELLKAMDADWPLALGDALARSIAISPRPPKRVKAAFVELYRVERYQEALLETALPRATRDLSPKQLADVGELFGERGREAWEAWLEEHPPRRAVSRAVRGVLRRGERE